jgi:hypothetical protein
MKPSAPYHYRAAPLVLGLMAIAALCGSAAALADAGRLEKSRVVAAPVDEFAPFSPLLDPQAS